MIVRLLWVLSLVVAATVAWEEEECYVDSQGQQVCHDGGQATPVSHSSECRDDEDVDCEHLAHENGCVLDFVYMNEACPYSCHRCDNVEEHDDELYVASVYHHEPQRVGVNDTAALERLEETERYMQVFYTNESLAEFHTLCQNREELCASWASSGECEANPTFMNTRCAPSCFSCHMILYSHRCPMPDDIDTQNAWKEPTDLDAMFKRVATDAAFAKYKPTILSAPLAFPKSSNDTQNGPWVIYLDDFLTPAECDRLIELGGLQGYERSADVGELQFDGTFGDDINDDRTSTNAWCSDDCMDDPVVNDVHARMEDLIQIGRVHYEDLQLLRYEETQHYRAHHDYIPSDLIRLPGVRILTVFLYLNDVPAGGGTHFPRLDLVRIP
jgi:prolyl 4-hydroxylase